MQRASRACPAQLKKKAPIRREDGTLAGAAGHRLGFASMVRSAERASAELQLGRMHQSAVTASQATGGAGEGAKAQAASRTAKEPKAAINILEQAYTAHAASIIQRLGHACGG